MNRGFQTRHLHLANCASKRCCLCIVSTVLVLFFGKSTISHSYYTFISPSINVSLSNYKTIGDIAKYIWIKDGSTEILPGQTKKPCSFNFSTLIQPKIGAEFCQSSHITILGLLKMASLLSNF